MLRAVHPIFQAILEGRYGDGLTLHASLTAPTGTDDRWAGYCLYALGQLLPAKDLLLRAQAAGCHAAGLELALVLRYLGDPETARQVVEAIPLETLEPLDRAYALRERASASLFEGDLAPARQTLEMAWRLLMTLGPESQTLRLSVAQLLGYTYAVLGREAPALHYLQVSLSAQGAKRLHALHTRAQVFIYSGQYHQAQQDLTEAAAFLDAEPIGRAYHAYLTGLLARVRGQWTQALVVLEQAASLARQSGETSTEGLAELNQAAILTVRGDLGAAHGHLQRAGTLTVNPWMQALTHLRRGAWQVANGDPQASARLQQAREAFAHLGLLRETAWADLHLAAASLGQDTSQVRRALERAVEGRHALGNGAALLPELRLLPALTAALLTYRDDPVLRVLLADRQKVEAEPLIVELITLGGARLLADGQELRVGMRRTSELLAFLLCRGPATREGVLAALWPDDDPRRAANYFHQARHELTQHVPYLRVQHEPRTGSYQVVCEGPTLIWDVEVIQRGLNAGQEDGVLRAIQAYGGPFLPGAESEWVREERDLLEWNLIKSGLELMSRWSAAGEYVKCASLARRLLDISPCDEALVEYLVEATVQLEGRAAAQRTLTEVAARAERELSHLPDWSGRLALQLQRLN